MQVARHPASHPVDRLTEHQTLVEVYDDLLVLFRDMPVSAQLFEVTTYHFISDLHEVVLEYILAARIEQMQRRLPMIERELDDCVQTLLDRLEGVVLVHYLISLLGYDVLDQRRQVSIVVVERIAVDTAAADDVLDRYLSERPVFEKLQESFLDLDLRIHNQDYRPLPRVLPKGHSLNIKGGRP